MCLNTKAVKIYLAAGYSSAEFLLAWEQFTSDHGTPATVHSDRGSQLVSASKEVESPEYNWDEIEQSTGGFTKWVFCPSAAQWRNGASEAFVKKAKRCITHVYQNRNFTFHEMQTAMKRVASILNSRPVSATSCTKGGVEPDYLTAITPNMMLLGRANCDVPMKDYEDTDLPLVRLKYVTEVEAMFWSQFKAQEFHALVPTHKWQRERRNMRKGDVVLIQYKNKSKSGEYKLGRIVKIEVDADGLVRTCIVRYSLIQHLTEKEKLIYKGVTKKYIRVAIQRLVLILPVEEQTDIDAVDSDEEAMAEELVGAKEEEKKKQFMNERKKNSIVAHSLKCRFIFDSIWEVGVSRCFAKST